MKKGMVFNIQHFSYHDGPGIRTVVFLKGCPLRCKWCANPESQILQPQMGWTRGECIHCKCCVHGASCINCRFDEAETLHWDQRKLTDEEQKMLRKVCPSEAFHLIGKEMTVSEVLEQAEKDKAFYATSGGGDHPVRRRTIDAAGVHP